MGLNLETTMRDKTRKAMDELGHIFVKDALEHALKMKYALMRIYDLSDDPEIKALAANALADK